MTLADWRDVPLHPDDAVTVGRSGDSSSPSSDDLNSLVTAAPDELNLDATARVMW